MTPSLRPHAPSPFAAAALAALLARLPVRAGRHRRRGSPSRRRRRQAAGGEPEGPRERCTPSSAPGYYERGQMDVALEELNEAAEARSRTIRGSTTSSASSTRCSATTPKAEQNFQRALALAPQDSEIRHNWGWYLCSNGRSARIDRRVRAGAAQSAVQDARDRAGQRRPVQRSPSATSPAPRLLPARARRIAPNNPGAIYGLALIAYRAGRHDEARGWMQALMQQPTPPPEALYLGMCIERKQRRSRSARASYVAQLRNRYPDSAEAKAITTGPCE